MNASSPNSLRVRKWVSYGAWLPCIPGMLMQVLVLGGGLLHMLGQRGFFSSLPDAPFDDWWVLITLPLSFLSWPILLYMTSEWIHDRPVRWIWPVFGTFCAMAWLLPMGKAALALVIYVPTGVLLACYLVVWHLAHARHLASAPEKEIQTP